MNKNRYITGIVGLILVSSILLGVGGEESEWIHGNFTYGNQTYKWGAGNLTYPTSGNWTWVRTVSNTSDTPLYIYPDVYHGRIGYFINGTWTWVETTWTRVSNEELAEKYFNLWLDTQDELDRIKEQLLFARMGGFGLALIIGALVITSIRKVKEKEVTSCEEFENLEALE